MHCSSATSISFSLLSFITLCTHLIISGDLEFQPEELVKAGVDPEAVGLKVNSAARTRTKSSSKSSNRVSNTFTEIQLPPDDDYDFDLGLRSFNTDEDLRSSLINDNRVLVPAKPLPSRFR